MKTHLLIEIDHSKALPDDVTDDVANRVYTMLHARGVACDVTVKIDHHPNQIKTASRSNKMQHAANHE